MEHREELLLELVNECELATTIISQMRSLFFVIKEQSEGERNFHVKTLVELGQYLGDYWSDTFQWKVEEYEATLVKRRIEAEKA